MLEVPETPLQFAREVSAALGSDVFVKRDDLTHPRYGGNKIRKLAYLLDDARRREATDLITVGAVGSHHVLATVVHGTDAGFEVHAVLVPQPHTVHVEETVLADLALGARLIPARPAWRMPGRVLARAVALRRARRRPYIIAIGGSSPLGAAGYVDAVTELVDQQARGDLGTGWPDAIVCALGSGGTHAGIVAGVVAHGIPTRVVGVRVAEAWVLRPPMLAWMARRATSLAGRAPTVRPRSVATHDIHIDDGQFGPGYGYTTDAAREATELFARDGIVLDGTYTAKAAAGLIALARRTPGRYLFWHTLSSAPLAPLIGPTRPEIPDPIRALFLPPA